VVLTECGAASTRTDAPPGSISNARSVSALTSVASALQCPAAVQLVVAHGMSQRFPRSWCDAGASGACTEAMAAFIG
jgi:hypothetical protein